jgi:hypothetical protein
VASVPEVPHHPSRTQVKNEPGRAAFPRAPGLHANAPEGKRMDWSSIERGWKHYKTSAQERWNRLSHQDVEGTMGRRDELARLVQMAYGLTREETQRHISMWLSKQAATPPFAAS